MFCIKCGRDLPDDAKYCYICGEPAYKPGEDGYDPEDFENGYNAVETEQMTGANPPRRKRKRRRKLQVADVVAVITGLVVCTAVIFAYLKIDSMMQKPEEPQRPDEPPRTEASEPSAGTDTVQQPEPTQMPQMPQMQVQPGGGDNAQDGARPDAGSFGQFENPDEEKEKPAFDENEGKLMEGKYKADLCRLEKKDDVYYLYPVDDESTLFQGENDTGITFSGGLKIAEDAKVGVAVSESASGDGRRPPDFTYENYDFYKKVDELFSDSHWQYTDQGYDKEALSFEIDGKVHAMEPVITVDDKGEISEILDFYLN